MRCACWWLIVLVAPCLAQEPAENEQAHLRGALAEAGSSPVDFIRALEKHLEKYPRTSQRAELERALVKAAVETGDNRRVLLYGEKALTSDPRNLLLLERVARLLLDQEDAARSRRALGYSQRLQAAWEEVDRERPPNPRVAARRREEVDQGLAKAWVYQARAEGNLGRKQEAVELARRGYSVFPSAEAAREIGRWLARLGRAGEAVTHYADAFAITDPNNTEPLRAKDRALAAELYRKAHDSETGLGDLLLAAYDRTSTLLEKRRRALRELDPNANLGDPLQFTLTGLAGDKLALATLRGKVLVLDFWATWCVPCRAQQPLYEEAMRRYRDRPEVVFLNISTDEERALVKPFLDEQNWNKRVYFEDGLSILLKVHSIPTTILFNRRGEIASRMNGFIPERFVEMLVERIDQALAEN